jgi:hypothetical protein
LFTPKSITTRREKMNATKESPFGTIRKTATGEGGLFAPKSITTRGDKKVNTTKVSPRGTSRTTARIVGVLFIIGTGAGVPTLFFGGRFLNAPDLLNMVAANASQVGLQALLVLVMGVALALVPAMVFPILKRQNEALAVGYVIFRGALESLTYIATAMCWLLLVVVARQSADSMAAVASQFSSLGILLLKARDPILAVQDIVFSLGALMFYYLLYQARLIPRWLSGWGLIGAILYGAVGLIYVFTGTTLVIVLMPLALQEMVMAIWLIVKGFNPSAIASLSAKTATNELLSAS